MYLKSTDENCTKHMDLAYQIAHKEQNMLRADYHL